MDLLKRRGQSEAVPHVIPICDGVLSGFLGALSPPRRARPGPGPHSFQMQHIDAFTLTLTLTHAIVGVSRRPLLPSLHTGQVSTRPRALELLKAFELEPHL